MAPYLKNTAEHQIKYSTFVRIIESTQEEQNNERFIGKIIRETIEVVYQTLFNLLSKFGTKELKKCRKRLQRNQ